MCARFDDYAPVVIVDVEHDEAIAVTAVLVDEDDVAACSADPCSGNDVRSACAV